ncbi:accessory factor UbiK family protein [Candidatus Berkiella aquae]|uniref:Ubiquinone biosynthesis accessory factor UbiK n=2 Tax=Candidatus Berkiella aquae TaxID=295108 RepID=A0A0Q9YYN4_9GAMM|nr:accessory factor UbiK family protein [Candidatus Berkiella aquae]
MFDPKLAQDMAKQFVDSLPSGVKAIQQEIENQLRQFLQQSFNKMDLVTREEFDIQTQVLAKTRAKLTTLEETVKTLESKLSDQSS